MKQLIVAGLLSVIGPIVIAADCDPKPGKKAFASKCGICHVMESGAAHSVGPNLHQVLGRAIGKAPGFAYSEALATATGQWTETRLNEFLASPQNAFPGTVMPFEGLKSESERQKLICYLTSLT